MRRLLLTLMFLAALPACYEGWEEEPEAGTGGPSGPVSPVETKPLAYILFQPIALSASAMADQNCFAKTGIREFRANEWALRTAAIQASAEALADKVVTKPVSIGASDCNTLSAILAESLKRAPWEGSDAPEDDARGRPALHLKAIFWEDDVALTPPSPVTTTHWSAWQGLADQGRPVESRHYFVIASDSSGYFSEWRDALPDGVKKDGTPITQVDPTTAGIKSREELIAKDTAALTAWLKEGGP